MNCTFKPTANQCSEELSNNSAKIGLGKTSCHVCCNYMCVINRYRPHIVQPYTETSTLPSTEL